MDRLVRNCRYSVDALIGRFGAIALYPITSVLALLSGIIILIDGILCSSNEPGETMLKMIMVFISFGISLYLIILGYRCRIFETRRYKVDRNGLAIYDRTECVYTWDNVYEIAIVAYAASASRQRYQTVICVCLEKPEKDFLKKMFKRYLYAVMNTHRFITIDYSETVEKEIGLHYPRQIKDYRNDQFR